MNKIRSFYVFIFVLGVYNNFYAQDFWKQLQSPTNHTLRNIFFADSLNGWAAGDSGVLIRTTDGGSFWQLQNTGIENTIWGIHFLDNELGWMVSWLDDTTYNGTLIHKTTNGGETWVTYEFPQTLTYIEDIHFIDSLTGLAGVSYSTTRGPIYHTTDGGVGWVLAEVQPDTLNFPFLPVKRFYSSENKLFACGGAIDIAGVIWKSSDNGFTWQADSTVAPDPINELYFFDSLNVLGIGGDRELLFGVGMVKTSNGGNSWEYFELEMPGVANSMDFRTLENGWASLGSQQQFISTVNSGIIWTIVPTPDNTEINDIIFVDSTRGFAVGKDGVILKYIYEPNSAGDYSNNVAQKFYLYQNYPNPFNPRTTLSFVIVAASGRTFVTLKVFDVLGNEVAVLVNEEKSPGEYEIEFVAEGLTSGIYYYRLTTEDYSLTKKMILLK